MEGEAGADEAVEEVVRGEGSVVQRHLARGRATLSRPSPRVVWCGRGGEARRGEGGEARRGEARRGEARRGEARPVRRLVDGDRLRKGEVKPLRPACSQLDL